jgi:chloramphenicol-sensitive protein RarD
MPSDAAADRARERKLGLAYAFATYGFWGLFPLYLKAVGRTPVLELLCHRIVWAALLLVAIVWQQGHAGKVAAALRHRRTLAVLGASTVLIAVNWLTYIFSVTSGRMLESSLGYYINPLVNVALGVLLLGETLAPLVRLAVAIAAGGVLWLGLHLGHPPWISLVLAFSVAFYGLLRKVAPVGPLIGLTVETLLLLPLAGGYLVYVLATGRAAFLAGNPGLDALLVLAGPLTAIPLLWFAAAARRLPLSTIGFIQYLSPTLQFLLAVAVYGEVFDSAKAVAFACIWTALALFAWHSVRRRTPEPVIDA